MRGELQDVSPADLRQELKPGLQLAAPLIQQLPQAPVVPVNLVPLLLVPAGPALQPLALLLGAQLQLFTWERWEL